MELTRENIQKVGDAVGAYQHEIDDVDLKLVPVVPQLHTRMLAAIKADPGALCMGSWHLDNDGPECGTTHCRAGWAIHLAGTAGYTLEKLIGPGQAGALIHLKSCEFLKRVPDFFCGDDSALLSIKRAAAIERKLAEAAA